MNECRSGFALKLQFSSAASSASKNKKMW